MLYETWFGFRNSGFNSEKLFRWEDANCPFLHHSCPVAERGGGEASSEYLAHPIGIYLAAASAHPVTRPVSLNPSRCFVNNVQKAGPAPPISSRLIGLWVVESAETCLVGAGLTQFRPLGKVFN